MISTINNRLLFLLLITVASLSLPWNEVHAQPTRGEDILNKNQTNQTDDSSPVYPFEHEDPEAPGPESVPGNDSYANATLLTIDASCINGTNKEATTQVGEAYGCQGTCTKTVWYKFIATSTSHFVEIELISTSGCYLSSAVWNASGNANPPTGSPLSCEDANGGPNLNIHNLSGLSIGSIYYIQVSYTGGFFCGNNNSSNTGTNFCIQVGTPVSCVACNNPCGPVCQFNSTPTLAQVQANCTKYDLKSRINRNQWRTACFTFTAIYHSLNLQMVVNYSGCFGGPVLQFNWTVQNAACGAIIASGNLSNLNATGLTVGGQYVLCYSWQAACQHNFVYPYIVSNSPLPVEMLSFTAQPERERVKIKWMTASEINNDHFEIERSTNGLSFKTLQKVQGAGNYNGILSYSFFDEKPVPGNSYYRLKQVDINGAFSISQKVAVNYVAREDQVTIIPNPVKSEMHVKYYASQNDLIILRITDMTGTIVLSKPVNVAFEGLNLFSFTVDELKPGIYTANLMRNDKTITTRFSKQ